MYLGVEDNGKITRVHESHRDITQLAAFIANKTIPPVTARVGIVKAENKRYIDIEVPKSRIIIAASNGKVLRTCLPLNQEAEILFWLMR